MSGLIREKIEQAFEILGETGLDCWMTFVRETAVTPDPALQFLVRSGLTWHSAFLISRSRTAIAIVGELDRAGVEDLGVYDRVIGYREDFAEPLGRELHKLAPKQLAVNYSPVSEVCDGLTHGLFLTLEKVLSELNYSGELVSSEPLLSRLRARKTAAEVESMIRAIEETEEIFAGVGQFLKAGRSEREVADFVLERVRERDLELAWDPAHCPAVFSGPDTAGAHYHPTERRVEEGHVVNMDFGVKVEGYCSDLQRTFYIRRSGEAEAPEEVLRGFETIVSAIEAAREMLRPGVQGVEVDRTARDYLAARGYEEFPHGLGHQVGRHAHDGTALLGPAWDKYGEKPFHPVEEGMVFTIEPRLTVPGFGVVTVEEMVRVGSEGSRFLSTPQKSLILI